MEKVKTTKRQNEKAEKKVVRKVKGKTKAKPKAKQRQTTITGGKQKGDMIGRKKAEQRQKKGRT